MEVLILKRMDHGLLRIKRLQDIPTARQETSTVGAVNGHMKGLQKREWTSQFSIIGLLLMYVLAGDSYFYGYINDNGNNIGFNGLATVEQTITFCPNTKYAFSAYVGYYDQSIPDQLFNTTVTVTLGGATIVPTQLTCSSTSNCDLPVESGIGGYRQITGDIITPDTSTSTLKIVFDFSSITEAPLYGTVLDLVTLTLVS